MRVHDSQPAMHGQAALRRVLALAALVLLALILIAAMQTSMPEPARTLHPPLAEIPKAYFGMHIHWAAKGTTPWPEVPFGSILVGDGGVHWEHIEAQPGKFDFQELDAWVRLAEQHNVTVLLPLGMTPRWASARPDEPGVGEEPGLAAEPKNIDHWRSYVRGLATRYKGRIEAYQIWNEPNAREYFTGSIEQMVQLTCSAYQTIKSVDPAATVVSPAPTMRSGVDWLDRFLAAGGGDCIDVVGYHFYVFPNPPEAMVSLIEQVKQVMLKRGVAQKPLWNTESGWSKPKTFATDEEAAAYVARAYVLNWASGVSRFYWYAWDEYPGDWATLYLSTRNHTMTLAGQAYAEVERWLLGARMDTCEHDPGGGWKTQITRDGKNSWIVWNPDHTAPIALPKRVKLSRSVSAVGTEEAVREHSIQAGPLPKLIQP